jgi:hypothetical protein
MTKQQTGMSIPQKEIKKDDSGSNLNLNFLKSND